MARPGNGTTAGGDVGRGWFPVDAERHRRDAPRYCPGCAAALRDGGLVLVSVPHFGSWQPRRFRDRWYHLDLPRHRVHFTRAALAEALSAAGLRLVHLSTSTSAVGLPATLQYAVFGHCLFPDGLRLRVASGLCALALPISRLADLLGKDGDVLHAVGVRRDE